MIKSYIIGIIIQMFFESLARTTDKGAGLIFFLK